MNLKYISLVVFTVASLLTPAVNASVILGTGTSALVGGDLTDPENDGLADANVNYNAVFRANNEPGFGGGEYAFNVFDNILSPGNGKWCCSGPSIWVEADFGNKRFLLSSFTLSSANDVPSRDADHWSILGSNDGINYTALYTYNVDGTSIWGDTRYQVIQFSNQDDYNTSVGYSIFRYQAYSVVSGSNHQLGEIEFFGTEVSEPSILAFLGLGLLGLSSRRFKVKK